VHRKSIFRAFAGVTVANGIFTALSFITSPLSAHALGPSGRGQLAAILVPFSWGALLANMGLPIFAARAAAQTSKVGDLIGTLGLTSLAFGLIGMVVGIPAAFLLAPHDLLVRDFILLGLLLMPLNLITALGTGLANGLETWMRLNLMRVIPPVLTVIAYIVLISLHALTVRSAAIVVYCSSIAVIFPLIGIGRRQRPFTFDRLLMKRATSYGRRAWVGSLAASANARLDQLLMIPLVSSRQLGLYAVAVNVSGLTNLILGALNTVIGPSIARGNWTLAGRAVRLTMMTVATFSLVAALAVPPLFPIVFGPGFAAAIPMCLILLAAAIPGSGAWVLGVALQNAGHPGIPARGEIGALVLTATGLALLLPPLAGVGAAIVSGVAYTTNLTIQLVLVRRRLGTPVRVFLLPNRGDIALVLEIVRRVVGRV
jgi:O-antigen/teichoic acid export membrane protein